MRFERVDVGEAVAEPVEWGWEDVVLVVVVETGWSDHELAGESVGKGCRESMAYVSSRLVWAVVWFLGEVRR